VKKIIGSIFLIFAFGSILGAETADSFAEARLLSSQTNKPILIDFWADN
jgi:hypothetical protein